MALIVLVFSAMELSWAARRIPLNEVIDVILGHGTWANNLLVKDNAVRLCMALFVGAGLAVCGCAMQAVFRNPMASPYIIGLSSGASVGAAIGILITVPFIPYMILTPVLSFVFCFLTMLLVYGVSRIGGKAHTETLILTGIAVSSMLSALVSFMTFIAGEQMADIVFWSMGSLSRATADELLIIAPIIVTGIIWITSYSKDLNAMMLGDHHAMDLGIEVSRVRFYLLVLTTIVVAAAVSFAGTIGFVGLIIPHIFRIILGPDNRALIPVSALGGAAFLLMCDYMSHIV
ncbi:MAG: iron ABC transporter permease, partial [Candidatus Methanomethylophilaceae archaeon]|nr:iron ABC transporter permease [Candidatus Methanomethylophilaceae archaeon]